jgi:hypothetical protein
MEIDDLFQHATQQAVEARRIYLARRVADATAGVVQHGPLTGYYLGNKVTWRESDNGAKLLGLYEKEVCELLDLLSKDRHVLVDLGGADGFYGVGLIASGKYKESHCFEIVDASRQNIVDIANSAGVASQVHVYGAATPSFASDLKQQGVDFAQAVVLCDIEGAEFDVLTNECLHALKDAHVIIEVHDFLVHGGREKYVDLLQRADEFFHVSEIKTGARDLSGIPLLADHWTDTDRWLLCSESRAKLMSWLYFAPK